LDKKRQFRIKYYDYDDSELYDIIQMASNEPSAILDAIRRIQKSTADFKIISIAEINNDQFYIKEIRQKLTNTERDEPNWPRRKRKMTG
jgi:hypothetical protein